jgi:hypothetical protein
MSLTVRLMHYGTDFKGFCGTQSKLVASKAFVAQETKEEHRLLFRNIPFHDLCSLSGA